MNGAEMSEEKKNIIVLKTKIDVPALNSTALMMLFLDYGQKKFIKISTLTISGHHLFEVDIKEKILQVIPKMIHGQEEYTVNRDYDLKLKNGMTAVLDPQNAEKLINALSAKDVAVVDNFLRGNIRKVLAEDKVELKFAIEQVGNSVFNYLQTIETLEHMTFAQKIEIVKKFNGGKKEIADKILKDSINDVLIVKISAVNSGMNILIVVYISIETKVVVKTEIAAVKTEVNLNVRSTFVDFIAGVHDLMASSDNAMGIKIDSLIKSLVSDTIISVTKGLNDEKITQFVKAAFNSILPSAKIEASADLINSLFLYGMVDFSSMSEKTNADSDAKKNLKAVDIKLVLSPSKGKSLLKLNPGDKIFVIPDKETPSGKKMIDQLKLEVEGKIKHLVVPLHEVKKDAQNGYEVLVKMSADLYGKSYEEQDVRVKFVETDEPVENKGKMSIVVGLAAGFLVIAATVFIIVMVI